MNKTNERIKSDVKKLRFSLSLLTILILIYLLSWFTIEYHGIHPLILIGLLSVLSIIHLILYIIFIYYVSIKYPTDQKSRMNNTLMIIFLGIIGMWLWLPSEKEIDRLSE